LNLHYLCNCVSYNGVVLNKAISAYTRQFLCHYFHFWFSGPDLFGYVNSFKIINTCYFKNLFFKSVDSLTPISHLAKCSVRHILISKGSQVHYSKTRLAPIRSWMKDHGRWTKALSVKPNLMPSL
jgi:hypothetical protein